MKQKIIARVGLIITLSAVACSSGSPEPSTGGQRQQYVAKGECAFESCGSLPSSFQDEPKLECASADGDRCEWDAASADDVVSYAFCKDSECPPRPVTDCPEGTKQSQQCGNENDAGCAWTTTCTPPRETTPCPAPDGCDSQPLVEIAVICADGSGGELVCVTDETRCYWERSCD
jgi:hypothetical protein